MEYKVTTLEWKKDNYVGKTINNLLVLDVVQRRYPGGLKTQVRFKCHCGKEHQSNFSIFAKGKVYSCGCTAKSHPIHGEAHSEEYRILGAMKQRCYNTKNSHYKQYGGRGIKICDRWLAKKVGIINFIEDMGRRPSKGHSIDRINVNGNYEPSNCRWATNSEQGNNKQDTVLYEYGGLKLTLTEWAHKIGIKPVTLSGRIHFSKIPFELAISTKKFSTAWNRKTPIKLVDMLRNEETEFSSIREARKIHPGLKRHHAEGKLYKNRYYIIRL